VHLAEDGSDPGREIPAGRLSFKGAGMINDQMNAEVPGGNQNLRLTFPTLMLPRPPPSPTDVLAADCLYSSILVA
jgi:hypothetical protein